MLYAAFIQTLKTIAPFLMAFTALSLAFIAVRIGRRATPPADPFSRPFGEMPRFTAEQLRLITPPVDTDDPLRRSFAVRNRLKRDADPLARFLIPQTRTSAGAALRPDEDGGRSLFPVGRPAAVHLEGGEG